jgi:PAS domain S-box-containing protein
MFRFDNREQIIGQNVRQLNGLFSDLDICLLIDRANIKTVENYVKLKLSSEIKKFVKLSVGSRKLKNKEYTIIRFIEEKIDKLDSIDSNRIKLIYEKLNDVVWDWDINTGKVYFSPKMYEWLGFPREEYKFDIKSFLEIVHIDDLETLKRKAHDHFEFGGKFECEYRLNTKDDSVKWVWSRGEAVEWENGKPIRMLGFLTDIGERKTNEQFKDIYLSRLEETNRTLNTANESMNKKALKLINPEIQARDYDFRDLFDISQIQNLQNSIAETLGVSSQIVDMDGENITEPSLMPKLCRAIIDASELGKTNCIKHLKSSIEADNLSGGAICSFCGLKLGGAVIYIDKRPVAYWTIGHCLEPDSDLEELSKYAEQIGVDKADYIRELENIPKISEERFALYVKCLNQIAGILSNLAVQNLQQAKFIVEKEKIEEALSESEDKLQLITSQMPGLIWTTDKNLKINRISGGVLKKFYKADSEIIGLKIDSFFVCDGANNFPLMLHQSALNGASAHFEYKYMDLELSCEIQALKNRQNEIVGVLGAATDIRERKIMESNLKESLQRFTDVTNAAGEFVWETDQDWNIVFISAKADEIFGSIRNNSRIKEIFDFAYLEDYEPLKTKLNNLAKQKLALRNVEFRAVNPNGDIIWINISATPVFVSSGELKGYRGVGSDVSQLKNAEEIKNQLIADLEAKNSEMERFTYTVSHDLKSPLITIKGFVGMLEQDIKNSDSELINSDIRRISSAADKMQNLLEDLLELSRIGRIAQASELIKSNHIIEETLELLYSKIKESGAEIKAQSSMPDIFGDRVRVGEVFQNLIENAIKFRRKDIRSEIIIECVEYMDRNEFIIKDNGQGFDPQYADKIFGLFDKLANSAEGSGVGLAIVKRIMEVHGGKAFAKSKGRDEGAEFHLIFPNPIFATRIRS